MKTIALLALLLSGAANAHLFQSTASKIEGTYSAAHTVMVVDHESEEGWVEAEVEDNLKIKRLTRKKIKFEMELWFTNAHSCYMEGTAKKVSKNKFQYIGEADFDGNICKLDILVDKKGIKLKDENGACKWNNCGMRGYIDGTRFEF